MASEGPDCKSNGQGGKLSQEAGHSTWEQAKHQKSQVTEARAACVHPSEQNRVD